MHRRLDPADVGCRTIEMSQKVLTLDDGTELYWTDDVTITEPMSPLATFSLASHGEF